MNATLRALLQLLADGAVHSGQKLGGELGISRAAVCKQLQGLGQFGIDLESFPGLGYQLETPLELLELSLIKERVAMGLERARKESKPHGRPKRIFDRERAQQLRDEGKSYRAIGRILGVNKGTIAGQLTN